MRLPGTPPVFLIPLHTQNPMTKNPKNPLPPEDDDREHGMDRIDADPPYGSSFPAKVKRFRELLAEMIARQIQAERRGPKNSNNTNDS
jgi:hypothetical protein